MAASQNLDIKAIMRHEFGASKRYWNLLLILQAGMLVFGWVSSSAPQSEWWAILPLVVAFAMALFKFLAELHHERGERARRLIFQADGLGCLPALNDTLMLAAERPLISSVEPSPQGEYYSSTLSAGTTRLLENLHESSFYSFQLARRARAFFLSASGIGALSGVTLIFMHLGNASETKSMARVSADVIAFFAAGSLLEAALVYHQLTKSALEVFDRCGYLRQEQPMATAEKVQQLVGAYDFALAKGRPIPTLIYRLFRSRLRDAWTALGRKGKDGTEAS